MLAPNEGGWRVVRTITEAAFSVLLVVFALYTLLLAISAGSWFAVAGAGITLATSALVLAHTCILILRPGTDGALMWVCWFADATLAGFLLGCTWVLSQSATLHSWQVKSLFGAAVRDHSHAFAKAVQSEGKLHAE